MSYKKNYMDIIIGLIASHSSYSLSAGLSPSVAYNLYLELHMSITGIGLLPWLSSLSFNISSMNLSLSLALEKKMQSRIAVDTTMILESDRPIRQLMIVDSLKFIIRHILIKIIVLFGLLTVSIL